MTIFLFALVVVFAGAFAFLNGFRDASASVALAVRTRALTPTVAILLAGPLQLCWRRAQRRPGPRGQPDVGAAPRR